MKENDFAVDTRPTGRRNFLLKNQTMIGLAALLTLPGALSFIVTPFYTFAGGFAKEKLLPFAYSELYGFVMLVVSAELFWLLLHGSPFSRMLTNGMRAVGGAFVAAAVVIPHLPGYTDSGIAILALSEHFTLIDGALLAPGLLFLILASLIKAGFEMQREMDEIL